MALTYRVGRRTATRASSSRGCPGPHELSPTGPHIVTSSHACGFSPAGPVGAHALSHFRQEDGMTRHDWREGQADGRGGVSLRSSTRWGSATRCPRAWAPGLDRGLAEGRSSRPASSTDRNRRSQLGSQIVRFPRSRRARLISSVTSTLETRVRAELARLPCVELDGRHEDQSLHLGPPAFLALDVGRPKLKSGPNTGVARQPRGRCYWEHSSGLRPLLHQIASS
jgi:hypothetical protein